MSGLLLKQLIADFEINLINLKNGEEIRERLVRLEKEYTHQSRNDINKRDADEIDKSPLWLELVQISVRQSRLDLALILIGRLKITPLARVMQLILVTQASELNSQLAIHYISNYFGLASDESETIAKLSRKADDKSIHDLEPIFQFWLDAGKWDQIYDFIDDLTNKSLAKNCLKLMFYEQAMTHEWEENFNDSLKCHDRADSLKTNTLRLALKRFPENSDANQIEMDSQGEAWVDYATIFTDSDKIRAQLDKCDNEDMLEVVPLFRLYLQLDFESANQLALELMPEVIQNYVRGSMDNSKMQNEEQSQQILRDNCSLLTVRQKFQLAEVANHAIERDDFDRAGTILVCLKQDKLHLSLIDDDKLLTEASIGSLIRMHEPTNDTSIDLIGLFERQRRIAKSRGKKRFQDKKNLEESSPVLAKLCLTMGLLDECLRILISSIRLNKDTSRSSLLEACDSLANEIKDMENSSSSKFGNKQLRQYQSRLSTSIRHETIQLATELLANGEQTDRESISAVITFVVLVLILAIQRKPANNDKKPQTPTEELPEINFWLSRIESLATHLSALLDQFNASTAQLSSSDQLVRACSWLLKSAKANFEQISASEIARDCLRQLVQSVAGRCLMEGRYKQAASLHNQIEDYVNAVKALMRLGDLNVVIEYAMLVHDVTVHRISLNFLKHMRAPPELIEDFENRIRDQQQQ